MAIGTVRLRVLSNFFVRLSFRDEQKRRDLREGKRESFSLRPQLLFILAFFLLPSVFSSVDIARLQHERGNSEWQKSEEI